MLDVNKMFLLLFLFLFIYVLFIVFLFIVFDVIYMLLPLFVLCSKIAILFILKSREILRGFPCSQSGLW